MLMFKTRLGAAALCAAVMSSPVWAEPAEQAKPNPASEVQRNAASAATNADDPSALAMRRTLQERYPKTAFGAVTRTPMPGIWEVWMGKNVAYASEDGRYFLFGHLFDMLTQADLTAAKKEVGDAPRQARAERTIDIGKLPLNDAIKTVRGDGSRVLVVFSDPDCGYCRQLERNLGQLQNVTVYTFLYPLEELHPSARRKAQAIWCTPNRTAAWASFMLEAKLPTRPGRCADPIARTIALGQQLEVNGTPFIVFADGSTSAGALDTEAIESRLAITTRGK